MANWPRPLPAVFKPLPRLFRSLSVLSCHLSGSFCCCFKRICFVLPSKVRRQVSKFSFLVSHADVSLFHQFPHFIFTSAGFCCSSVHLHLQLWGSYAVSSNSTDGFDIFFQNGCKNEVIFFIYFFLSAISALFLQYSQVLLSSGARTCEKLEACDIFISSLSTKPPKI